MVTRNLRIKRGDDQYYCITFDDGTDPIDITGWVVYFTVKADMDDPDDDAVIKKDVSTHVDPEHGKTVIHLTHDDTEIDVKNYYYDIQVKKDNGDIDTPMGGLITVEPEVTQRKT